MVCKGCTERVCTRSERINWRKVKREKSTFKTTNDNESREATKLKGIVEETGMERTPERASAERGVAQKAFGSVCSTPIIYKNGGYCQDYYDFINDQHEGGVWSDTHFVWCLEPVGERTFDRKQNWILITATGSSLVISSEKKWKKEWIEGRW